MGVGSRCFRDTIDGVTIDIRALTTADEIGAGRDVFRRAMVGLPRVDFVAAEIIDPERSLGAIDDGRVVGHTGSFPGTMVIPGGARLPHAAVTFVGVLPTHRRRGVATGLMTEQLRTCRERGDVLASLRASEGTIYERYGYGVAGSARSIRVKVRDARLRPDVPAGGTVRLVDDAATTELLDAIHRREDVVGAIDRAPQLWRARELFRQADTGTPRYVVVHATDGVDDGYASYEPADTSTWFTTDNRTVNVSEFVALTPSARTGLWEHLLSLDLIDIVEFGEAPIDDLLPLALVDRRAAHLGSVEDQIWLRLLDVEEALRRRTYDADDTVVLEVTDPLLPENSGHYAIGPKGAERTETAADAGVDVATLAAAYLGGTRFSDLAAVGRVHGAAPGVAERLTRLFATPREPFCSTDF